jgi:hypothetical protein
MRSEADIKRDIDAMNGQLENVLQHELDYWLRYKHKECVLDIPKSNEDLPRLEADFVTMVMKKVTDSDGAKLNFGGLIHNILNGVNQEPITQNQQSLVRVLTSLARSCRISVKPPQPAEITSLQRIKSYINDNHWNNKGVFFLFFPIIPENIVALRRAQDFAEMQRIARQALSKDPLFRKTEVKRLYETIRDAVDESDLADKLNPSTLNTRSQIS